MATDKPVRDGHVATGIDGIVLGIGMHHAAGNLDDSLGLDALMGRRGGIDRPAREIKVSVKLDSLGAFGRGTGRASAARITARSPSASHATGRRTAIIGSRHNHTHFPALEIAHIVTGDSLAARARASDIQAAAFHDKAKISLDAGRSGKFPVDAEEWMAVTPPAK